MLFRKTCYEKRGRGTDLEYEKMLMHVFEDPTTHFARRAGGSLRRMAHCAQPLAMLAQSLVVRVRNESERF